MSYMRKVERPFFVVGYEEMRIVGYQGKTRVSLHDLPSIYAADSAPEYRMEFGPCETLRDYTERQIKKAIINDPSMGRVRDFFDIESVPQGERMPAFCLSPVVDLDISKRGESDLLIVARNVNEFGTKKVVKKILAYLETQETGIEPDFMRSLDDGILRFGKLYHNLSELSRLRKIPLEKSFGGIAYFDFLCQECRIDFNESERICAEKFGFRRGL